MFQSFPFMLVFTLPLDAPFPHSHPWFSGTPIQFQNRVLCSNSLAKMHYRNKYLPPSRYFLLHKSSISCVCLEYVPFLLRFSHFAFVPTISTHPSHSPVCTVYIPSPVRESWLFFFFHFLSSYHCTILPTSPILSIRFAFTPFLPQIPPFSSFSAVFNLQNNIHPAYPSFSSQIYVSIPVAHIWLFFQLSSSSYLKNAPISKPTFHHSFDLWSLSSLRAILTLTLFFYYLP